MRQDAIEECAGQLGIVDQQSLALALLSGLNTISGVVTGPAVDVAVTVSFIADDGTTVVLVEHDMRLVMNVSDRIHVLANGRTLAEGNASEVRNNPAVVEAYLGHGAAKVLRA